MDDVQIDRLSELFNVQITPCGSRVTCNPAPMGTDADYLVLVPSESALSGLMAHLDAENWKWEGASDHYQNVAANSFTSLRRQTDNLIVTTNPEFARLHKVATRICTRLNLEVKSDRVMVFQAVLYGNTEWAL